jgi:hypothetical protein
MNIAWVPRMRRMRMLPLAALAALCVSAGAARADYVSSPYSFTAITNNNLGAPEALEAQVKMEVRGTSLSAETVTFRFYVDFDVKDAVAMSLTDVYFDDGTILGATLSVTESVGVAFTPPAKPEDLPGGNSIDPKFETTKGFSAVADSPNVLANGVNAKGEYVDFTFALIDDQTVQDVLDDLASGVLRVGVHVQGIAPAGGSEAGITGGGPPHVVPGPTVVPLALSCAAFGLFLRRRQRRMQIA